MTAFILLLTMTYLQQLRLFNHAIDIRSINSSQCTLTMTIFFPSSNSICLTGFVTSWLALSTYVKWSSAINDNTIYSSYLENKRKWAKTNFIPSFYALYVKTFRVTILNTWWNESYPTELDQLQSSADDASMNNWNVTCLTVMKSLSCSEIQESLHVVIVCVTLVSWTRFSYVLPTSKSCFQQVQAKCKPSQKFKKKVKTFWIYIHSFWWVWRNKWKKSLRRTSFYEANSSRSKELKIMNRQTLWIWCKTSVQWFEIMKCLQLCLKIGKINLQGLQMPYRLRI